MNRRVLHETTRTACGLAIILTLLRITGEAAAQSSRASILTASPDSALTAVIADLPGERLFLDDAVADAAGQATDARIAEAQMNAATNAVRSEKGVFDPELFGSADWSDDDHRSASLFAGADVLKNDTSNFEAGARMRLRLGTEISASLNSGRLGTNSEFALLNPEYSAFGALTVRQPLLKGFGPSARSDLSVAERNLDRANALYDGAVLAVRAEVESVYWQLYAAERNHAVTRLIRDRAAAFHEDAQLRATAGMTGPSAVANAEFFLTEAEQALLDTEEQMDHLSDRLASLMGRRPSEVRYRVWDEPPREFPHVAQDTLVAVVMRHNPDLEALRSSTDALRALEKGAVWDARPTLDIFGSMNSNGLSGYPQDVYFGSDEPIQTTVERESQRQHQPGHGSRLPGLERGRGVGACPWGS